MNVNRQLSTTSGASKKRKKKEEEENLKKNKKISSFFNVRNAVISEKVCETNANSESQLGNGDAYSIQSTLQQSDVERICLENAGTYGQPALTEPSLLYCPFPGSKNSKDSSMSASQQERDSNSDPSFSASDNIKDSDTSVSTDEETSETEIGQRQTNFNIGLSNFISPNINDPITVKKAFLRQHPIQTNKIQGKQLPFDPSKLYYRVMQNGEKINRKWLSYSTDLNKVFCSSCMAFGDKILRDSSFVLGHKVSVKHIYMAVEVHEISRSHVTAAMTAVQCFNNGDIETYMNKNMVEKRIKEIETRRQVLQRIIDIVLFIGKQGIAYRGKEESAYALDGRCERGNFLELVLLVSNYDIILQTHVKNSIEESKKKKLKGNKGRGSLVTFLSKSFINKIIRTIASIGQHFILKEMKESLAFSIMVDSTQDVSVMDQLAICVRYVVKDKIYERLLSIQINTDSSGKGLFEQLKESFENFGIPLKNAVGCSFDGAANMKGVYNGLQSHLKSVNPNILYTHCMAHVLNLVVGSTEGCNLAENLFGLVEETAVFLSSSYKRMAVWNATTKQRHYGHNKLSKLQKIGATRWWSKHKALASIIDFNDSQHDKFETFLLFLTEVIQGQFDSRTKFLARTLLEKWCTFETLFTALMMLDTFSVTSPVSIFLQTKSIDYLQAWHAVETLLQQIDMKRDELHYKKLYEKCQNYTTALQNKFDDNHLIDVKTDFQIKRKPIKKKLELYECSDDEARNFTAFEENKRIYFEILDTVKSTISEKFVPNEDILRDCSWLDPKMYKKIAKYDSTDFPPDALLKLSELSSTNRSDLIAELIQFAGQYETFTINWRDSYGDKKFEENGCSESDSNEDSNEEEIIDHKFKKLHEEKQKCYKCLPCAFSVLYNLATQCGLFTNLFLAFKFIMVLPCTQVTCERVFSKLKIVKTRLRSLLSQDLLQSLLLMYVEKDIFEDINKDEVINKIALESNELKRKLMV